MFSAKDLSAFLSSEVSRDDDKADDKELEKAKFNPRLDRSKKVARYFPGKAPTWVAQDEREKAADFVVRSNTRNDFSSSSAANTIASDNRLARLASSGAASNVAVHEEGQPRRRRVYEAEVVEDKDEIAMEANATVHVRMRRTYAAEVAQGEVNFKEEVLPLVAKADDDDDDDDDEVTKRRARAMMHQHRLDASSGIAKPPPIVHTAVESAVFTRQDPILPSRGPVSDDEGSSEFETGSEDEEEEEEVVIKPMFVPKHKRDTLKDQATLELEEELKLQEKRLQSDLRQRQTREMVAESIKRNDERNNLDNTDVDSDAGLPDNLDDVDDDIEFDNWKLREMKRLARDAEERELIELERAYIEKRRQMTDGERLEDDRRMGKFDNKQADKSKYKFLQKYYHKGAFYVDDTSLRSKDDVRARDYSEPTLADKGVNREALPKIMQVKNFGKRGRTKYTHLADQDTTFADRRPFVPRAGPPPAEDFNPYMGGSGNIAAVVAHGEREDRIVVRHDLLRPGEDVRRALEQKRAANQSLDVAGRLHKKPKR